MTVQAVRSVAGVLAAIMMVTGQAHAQAYSADPSVVPDVKLADCTPRAALSYAMLGAIKRQAALADPSLKMLNEFEALNNKSTAKDNEPIYKGLSKEDVIRATQLTDKIAHLNGLNYTDSNYERDMRIINLMFSDALNEYVTGRPPEVDLKTPKSEADLAYLTLLAMRENMDGGKDDPIPTRDQSVCSVDLAFASAVAEPVAKYLKMAAEIGPVQADSERLNAKYGEKPDPTMMSPADAETYGSVQAFLVKANRTKHYMQDLENLRMLATASAIRRESYITDLTAGDTNVDFGGTLKKRNAAGEFTPSMVKALDVQDALNSMFPTEERKAREALAASLAKPSN
jgi:hypothetical protein